MAIVTEAPRLPNDGNSDTSIISTLSAGTMTLTSIESPTLKEEISPGVIVMLSGLIEIFDAAIIFIIAVLTLSLFNLFQRVIDFLAPTVESTQEPIRSLLASAFTVFMIGLYSLISRKDAVKTVIGIALLENGVHLVLLSLVPNLSETTMIGILTNVTVIVFILLYLSRTIYEVFGSTDTTKLSELKY